jgi:hypothetical protein
MIYNFNFYITKDGAPYVTTETAAAYLADVLENRTTSDKPLLEYRISTDLRASSQTDLLEQERQYLISIISGLPVDNYFKGRLAHPMVADIVDGVPTEVKLWQLRSQLAILGMEQIVTIAITSLPESTDAEKEFKVKAQNAWERADNVYRLSPTVTMIQQLLGLSDQQTDDIFKAAYLIEA